MVVELPAGHYLENFRYLLEFVTGQYSSLLQEQELSYLNEFQSLPLQAQMLYVRLIQRKGSLFRCDKIHYEEIDDLQQVICQLTDAGFLDDGGDVHVREVLPLLTKRELLGLPEAIGFMPSLKKDVILDSLADIGTIATGLCIIRPLRLETLQFYKLLFFGNLEQDFTEFVLNDLGVTRYEQYPLQPESAFFENRWMVEKTMELYIFDELSHEVIAEGDQAAMAEFVQSLPSRCNNERLSRRHDRIVNRIARQYERLGNFAEALSLYATSHLPPSRERRARILQKEAKLGECIEQCMDMLQTPENDQEREIATRLLHRLRKKINTDGLIPDLDMEMLELKPIVKHVSVEKRSGVDVEESACDWFRQLGFDAIYVENCLIPGLFGLAFWDIIFAPVKSVFFNPFQRGPSDMFTPAFYRAREDLIVNRLHELEDQQYLRNLVSDRFEKKYQIANYFVQWTKLSRDLLDRFLCAVSNDALLSVFKRLLMDPGSNRSVFPDLVVFHEGGFKLVEVKGSGDRLQDNQRMWLHHFSMVGIPAEVVHVSWNQ